LAGYGPGSSGRVTQEARKEREKARMRVEA
jgi:hypothetical protein